MATKTDSPTKVVTGKVRLSYVHLLEPWTSTPEKPDSLKYSCVLLIPKSDKVTLKKLRDAIAAAAEAGKAKFGGTIPKNLKITLRDGDEEYDTDEKPEYAGHMFMNVGSRTRPGLVDQALNPILDGTEIYSGCYARASINAFAYHQQGSKGVSFGLNHIQKLADGEPLSGRSRPEDDFEAVETEDEEDLF